MSYFNMKLLLIFTVDSEHDHEFYIGGVNGLMVDSWRVPSSGKWGNS